MIYFNIIIVPNIIQILYCLTSTILVLIIVFSFIIFIQLGFVDFGSRDKTFLTLLIPLFLSAMVFFFLPSFNKRL